MEINRVTKSIGGAKPMALKAPGIVTFMIAIVLTVTVLIMKFFDAQIPFLVGNEFWGLLVAHVVLIFGCIMRGL